MRRSQLTLDAAYRPGVREGGWRNGNKPVLSSLRNWASAMTVREASSVATVAGSLRSGATLNSQTHLDPHAAGQDVARQDLTVCRYRLLFQWVGVPREELPVRLFSERMRRLSDQGS